VAPVVAEARPEAMATALHQVLVATEVQVEAPAEAALGPAPANGSRAVVVEVTDDNSPPPGWDQWVSFPTLSPESQEGVLVRRRDGHMVAGGRGHGAEASSSRACHSAQVEGVADDPPAFADAQEEQELWGELRSHGATLDRALNEALRVHGGPAWRVFQVRHHFPLFLVSACCFFIMMLKGFELWVTGARAPCPRQVRRLRSGERRAPPGPGAMRCLRRARRRPQDSGRLVGVPVHGLAR
jgi:hypothetical protein